MDRIIFKKKYEKELDIIMKFDDDWMGVLGAAKMRDRALEKYDNCFETGHENLLKTLILEAKKPFFEINAHGIFKEWEEANGFKHKLSSDTRIDSITDVIIDNAKDKSLKEWKKLLLHWLEENKGEVVENPDKTFRVWKFDDKHGSTWLSIICDTKEYAKLQQRLSDIDKKKVLMQWKYNIQRIINDRLKLTGMCLNELGKQILEEKVLKCMQEYKLYNTLWKEVVEYVIKELRNMWFK